MAWAGGSRDSSISEAGQRPHPLLLTEAKQRHDRASGETQGVSGLLLLAARALARGRGDVGL